MWLRTVVLYLHLVAAIFWVGEMMLLALVVGPVSRHLDPEARSELFTKLGRRSLPFAWAAVGVLLVTGVLNVALLGIPLGRLADPAFYRTPFGFALGIKLALVLVLLVAMIFHDVVLARRAERLRTASRPTDPAVQQALVRTRAWARWIGRLSLLLALVILLFAARLVALS